MIKDSFEAYLLLSLSNEYSESRTKRVLTSVGNAVKSSFVYGLLRAYLYRGYGVLSCGLTAFFNAVLGLFGKLCDKAVPILENSLFFRFVHFIVSKKTVFLCILTAYPFTDLIIRKTAGVLAGPWDELYFFAMLLLLVFDFAYNHKGRKYVTSPLNIPILIFLAVMFGCYFVVSPDRTIGFEGMRAVCEYIFWFYLVLKLCDSDEIAKDLCICLFVVLSIMALHGIYQYIVATPMPASWVDHNEAGVRTRVYSILTSPNVLGGLFTLTIPIGVGLFLEETAKVKKALYGFFLLCMCAALIFTFSRGAWMGFMAAVIVFVLFYNPRLLLPVIILAVLAAFLVPEVGNRISYMLSADYIESSMNGGRLIRWIDGLKVWSYGKLTGVGLGHFGGAVAINHGMQYLVADEYMETFYMDNYYLKTMIETGVVGLLAFVFLMYQVFLNSVRAVKLSVEHKYLKIGIMSGLFGIIVHNLVENIFEVPLMSTEFWIFAAVLMSFWYRAAINKKQTI
ncbi:MAG: O-antigen ligase family protein [Clostridiales bacterium]|nr:O-antigen ligase family protein [Clostridiales bacterium]